MKDEFGLEPCGACGATSDDSHRAGCPEVGNGLVSPGAVAVEAPAGRPKRAENIPPWRNRVDVKRKGGRYRVEVAADSALKLFIRWGLKMGDGDNVKFPPFHEFSNPFAGGGAARHYVIRLDNGFWYHVTLTGFGGPGPAVAECEPEECGIEAENGEVAALIWLNEKAEARLEAARKKFEAAEAMADTVGLELDEAMARAWRAKGQALADKPYVPGPGDAVYDSR